MIGSTAAKPHSSAPWLAELCVSRAAFTLIFTAYSAAIPLLQRDWSMSAAQAGLVQSAWHFGYLISLFGVGFLADRFGAKRVFVASGIAASASALLFAFFADGFVSGLLLYGLTALMSGGSYTPGLTLIAEGYPPQRRGRAMGYYLAASSLGYAVSLILSGLITPHAGWRGAFVATACGPLAGTLIAAYALRATPNVVHPRPQEHGSVHSLRQVLRNKPAMLLIWAYTFHSWELLGMWAWMPSFLAAASVSGASIGERAAALGAMLTALTYITSMAGSIFGGSLSDRLGRCYVILILSCASLACSFAFGWMIGLPLWLLVGVAAAYNVTAIGDSSIYSTAVTELVPAQYLGAAFSIRSVLGFGAGVISPWVFGLVLDAVHAGAPQAQSQALAWGLAWSSLGLGAVLGPLMTLKLRAAPEARNMAGGRR
ncbi:MAG TPA: MFS transporter [Burkholderiales bacterium]|nr:MFS transporter [Burkholderiales bacterium]